MIVTEYKWIVASQLTGDRKVTRRSFDTLYDAREYANTMWADLRANPFAEAGTVNIIRSVSFDTGDTEEYVFEGCEWASLRNVAV
jgi:hypothetical protein